MFLTGALTAGTAAVLAVAAPGVAAASGCGITTLDETTFPTTFSNDQSILAGTSTVVDGGLRVATPTGDDKAARYFPVANLALAGQTAQSNYALNITPVSGSVPSYQLVMDMNGPATGGFATLVFEQLYSDQGKTNTWWSTKPLDQIADRGGHGSSDWGTLDEISGAYPDAVITSFGYSLGRGPVGDATITGITFGCNEFRFDLANRAPIANTRIDDGGDQNYRTFWLSGVGSTDPDGDRLNYSWSVDGVEVSKEAEFLYTYPKGARNSTVVLTVSDGKLASVPEAGTPTRTVTVAPPTNTKLEGALPGTGADVLALAGVGGLVLAGGGTGLVLSRRRRLAAGGHAA
jgi:hypothetical protein